MADEEKIENDENKSTFKMTGFSFKKIAKPKSNLLTTKQLPSINDLIDIHDPDDGHGNDDKGKDFITSIDNNEIQCSNDEQQSIIIPLIKVNKYRNDKSRTCDSAEASPQLPVKNEDDCDDDDDLITKAKQELLEESRMIDDDDQLLPAWKSLMINKLPDEFKNDTKLDISMRPEVPKLNDYEQTPLNVYGAAMLRGMGWKEDGPIGGKRKAIAPIIEHQLRPRGIGIGADISLRKQLEQKNNFQKTTTGGCHVCVEFGPHKGYYGIVENLSGNESIYVTVKLRLMNDSVQLLQDFVRIVTKQEYDSESKSRERRQRSSSRDERMNYDDDDGGGGNNDDIWIVPKIRVQIIDKNYKNGRYYKEKVVITETRHNECICRAKDKKILSNITQSMLRTVIPSLSDPNIYVMILRGKYRGKLAKIKDVDWKHEKAMINLMGYISKPFAIALDNISEYRDDD
ncbi:hypothetical protein DERF_013858 [Dermatophagoides farinae]|uniref:Spp2/MOS2 G-patch domain-containing protein n=1 Tax=Dermatophagoides farinae TaxID=6954 RepID=A0A922HQD4_DERFA|nr:hypothetical protein DERF_013858 [Dermatophagoides farinae]